MSKHWSTPTRYFVLALVLVFLGWFLFAANDLIGPLAVAAIIAYVLNPVVAFVDARTKLSRRPLVILVFFLALAALAATGAILAPALPALLARLVEDMQRILLDVQRVFVTPVVVFGATIRLDQLLGEIPFSSASFVRADLILGLVRSTTTNIAWILVVVVTAYYLLQDWPRLRDWLLRLAPAGYRVDADNLYAEISGVWTLYLSGQLRLMLLVGVLTGLVSAAIGLPGAVAFGLLAGLLDIILSVGPTLATLLAAAVAFFSGSTILPISNAWFVVVVVVAFTAIQTAENIWLRPWIMGNRLRLHPAIVFVAVIGSLAMAGVLTALIIVPLVRSAMVIGRYMYFKFWDMDPWPDRAGDAEEKKENGEQVAG